MDFVKALSQEFSDFAQYLLSHSSEFAVTWLVEKFFLGNITKSGHFFLQLIILDHKYVIF